MHVVPRATAADGSRGGFAHRAARAWLAAAGIDDQLGATAAFAASTRPVHHLESWVLADLADPVEAPTHRVLVGVGSRAVYGFLLPRWHRAPTGLAFVLDPATTQADPPIGQRTSELVLRDKRSAQVIRLSGLGIRRAEIRAAIAAIRAVIAPPGTGPAP